MTDEDDVTTFRLHLEMHFCNFAVLKVLCMKPSPLKRKRCAQQFATNGAQFHPQNFEISRWTHRGVKLDTHVLCPLLRRTLSNSEPSLFRPLTTGPPRYAFSVPRERSSRGPRGTPGAPEMDYLERPVRHPPEARGARGKPRLQTRPATSSISDT